jgi:hypothetical protein
MVINDNDIAPSGQPGIAVETALNASQTQYLGPNTDLYFYDEVNGKLMARIENLDSFDYGCTQVVIDRAGASATQFRNTDSASYLMDKTFHVLPTTNNPSGSYKVTLFYTLEEVNGWESFTSQAITSIQLVKTEGRISDVSAANPKGGGAVTLCSPVISQLGSNTGLTGQFTNGFSDLGAGVPGPDTIAVPQAFADSGSSGFTISPNPFQDHLGILFKRAPTGQVGIRLLDMTGREMLRQSASPTAGSMLVINVPGTSLARGVYLLEVWYNGKRHVAKVVKQ